MPPAKFAPLIRSVSDTARWVAFHRATESERPDAVFRDPYARRLAGERGERIARVLHRNDWAIATRTYLFDNAIQSLLAKESIDMVVNLAAGLDSRPYRLPLPATLQWIEIDLPEIVETKRPLLANEKPFCQLEIITENLADLDRRRIIFSSLNQRAQNVMIMSEGLLLYLDEEKVTSLAADLLAQPHFRYWLVEIASPKVVEWVNRNWRHHFEAANAVMSFAPADWRKFFADRGWQPVSFEDLANTAMKINRAPVMMRVFKKIADLFPGWNAKQSKLWESGVALLRRA
jgi:methyltransferase (TIGR00027 family)